MRRYHMKIFCYFIIYLKILIFMYILLKYSWHIELCKFKLYTCVHAKSLQLCLTLCNPMDCSPPGSSVHGSLQARILEWVSTLSSRGSSWPRDQTPIAYISLHRQVGSSPLAPPGKSNIYTGYTYNYEMITITTPHTINIFWYVVRTLYKIYFLSKF